MYFEVQVSEHEWVTEKGLYLICVGYHKWRCLRPLKHALDHDEMNWGEHMESTFGSLKRRFQF